MSKPSLTEAGKAPEEAGIPPAPVGIAIDLASLGLPLRVQRRSWIASLFLASAAHAVVVLSMVATWARAPSGAGGAELEAINVEIVSSDVLESRSATAPAGAASDRAVDHTSDGGPEADSASPAADRERTSQEAAEQSAGLMPDLVLPDAAPETPVDEPSDVELTIARARPDAPDDERPPPAEPDRAERPSPEESPPSRAAAAAEQSPPGGADARGLDAVDAPGARAAAASPGAASEYAKAVIATLSRRKPRPTAGVRGTVRIRFTVAPTGAVSEARVQRSSGQSVLDEAALAAVRGARFPTPPPELAAAELSYEIPYIFR